MREYLVDVQKIPYFASFTRFQALSGREAIHDEIPFFNIIHYGVENGYRHFFRRLPSELSKYHVFCETLEFLAVDVLGGRKLREVFGDIRKNKWDCYFRSEREMKALKNVARDSAFRLVYLFLLGEFESDVRDSNMAYQATEYVVSHRSRFNYKTRKMVREALEDRFDVTEKQSRKLNESPVCGPWGWEPDDSTTEEEVSD